MGEKLTGRLSYINGYLFGKFPDYGRGRAHNAGPNYAALSTQLDDIEKKQEERRKRQATAAAVAANGAAFAHNYQPVPDSSAVPPTAPDVSQDIAIAEQLDHEAEDAAAAANPPPHSPQLGSSHRPQ